MRRYLWQSLGLVTLWLASSVLHATVLPDERSDVLYHSYDGGGVEVTGPSILVRKHTTTNTSIFYNYYVDHITSASLDVLIGGSQYEEERTEQSFGVDYLHGRTTMNLSYTDSTENDYNAGTLSFSISQDFFGDLSTFAMGYSIGNDDVSRRNEPVLSNINRQSYRLGFNQILSKNAMLGIGWETITDEADEIANSGVTLNNPYRSYSYGPVGGVRSFAAEKYPRTRTSNALAVRGSYYLPYRAALHGEVKYFDDSWGIEGTTYELGYTHPWNKWTFDVRVRHYDQNEADFYSDLFEFVDQYDFMARDKELSSFQSVSLGVTASREILKGGWRWIDRGSLNISWDHIEFSYNNYRDATDSVLAGNSAAGQEPLYSFGADIIQLFVSLWY